MPPRVSGHYVGYAPRSHRKEQQVHVGLIVRKVSFSYRLQQKCIVAIEEGFLPIFR